MALTNHQRVGLGLGELAQGLRPFVERELKAKFGDDWLARGLGAGPGAGVGRDTNPDDPSVLLKLMADNWRNVFEVKLARGDRNYVFETRDIRNRWAHNESFSTDDALRALDTMHRVLQAVSAGDQAIEVDRLRQDLQRLKFDEQARSTRRKAVSKEPANGDESTTGLPGWRQVAEPHDDVATGRYELAQFAADLHQVWRGDAAAEYGDPEEFFRRTYITEGVKELLLTAVRRFNGVGGDPIIKLQTNFGGGKTHSLIALFHLASGRPATELPGVEQILADASLTLPTEHVNRAVLVGHQLQPSSVSKKPGGIEVRTIWGELAWQLGGADAFELVADADAAGVSPGEALTDLFQMFSPCLVLVDEWVAYARQLYGVAGLPAGSFDAQFSFAQALTDAARNVPTALVVASIPASDIEVGGEGGRAALERIENVIGRMEATWRTASTEESFEIVRRRLFKDLSPDQARQRDAVVQAFAELYRSQSSEFPFECREADYERRMKAAYPIHPELFDRLFGDWSELERFQRTRGVLRLMAKVIHTLYMREDSRLLIMPGSIPIDEEEVASELTRYLDPGWTPVIETDVDGANSLPYNLDRENSSSFGKLSAARRIARTIYFGSAPSQQAATKGLDDRHIKLGCVQPGERPPIYGDALRRLSDQAMYLYRDGARYWYALKATVTRLAQDRAASHFETDDVDEEIRKRLDRARAATGKFARVHTAPRTSGDVPDEDVARLVVLGPEHTHDPKSEESPALTFAGHLLGERAGGARRYRNMLVFLAADRGGLDDLRTAVRQWLAWTSVDRDRDTLSLDSFQIRQVEAKVSETDETVNLRLAGTYHWVLNPNQAIDDPTGPIRWDVVRVTGSDPLAERVSKKLVTEESLIPAYSGTRLRLDVDRVPLWRGDHVVVNQLWEDYAQYLYLPRLVRREVLEQAISDGASSLSWTSDTFAYADTFDGERYGGLVAASQLAAVAPSGYLVKPDVAEKQLAAERGNDVAPTGHDSAGGTDADVGAGTASAVDVESSSAPTRYYGRVELDSARWTRTVSDIAESIVTQLERADGVKVKITIEIEADNSAGFSEALQRTVTENAATLRFGTTEFEK
ncbi:Swt1 family HEPN domain-containing protein [Gemmatimonas sp.]|uniref:Swt1 family HEPN domain-containing protein n=1 Tax=Gemmatimonas sp. TaxID=1962908 RepID=UPI00356A67CD